MGDMRQAARSAMAAQLISKLVGEHAGTYKTDLLALMADSGAERVRVTDDDDTDLGSVSVSSGRTLAKVTDVQAFTAWVADRYPYEMVQQVREAFAKKLLDAASAAGEPVDTVTGEVMPGVEVSVGDSYLTVRPSADAKSRMRETLRASGLLALPTGGEK